METSLGAEVAGAVVVDDDEPDLDADAELDEATGGVVVAESELDEVSDFDVDDASDVGSVLVDDAPDLDADTDPGAIVPGPSSLPDVEVEDESTVAEPDDELVAGADVAGVDVADPDVDSDSSPCEVEALDTETDPDNEIEIGETVTGAGVDEPEAEPAPVTDELPEFEPADEELVAGESVPVEVDSDPVLALESDIPELWADAVPEEDAELEVEATGFAVAELMLAPELDDVDVDPTPMDSDPESEFAGAEVPEPEVALEPDETELPADDKLVSNEVLEGSTVGVAVSELDEDSVLTSD